MEEKFFVICFRPPPALICAGLNLCCSVIKRHDKYVFFHELNSATWGSWP